MTTTYGNDTAEDGVIKVTTVDSAEGEQSESAEQVPETIDLNGLQPGEWLKQLREQKNLSIEHVADRLYLDTGVVSALEESDYAALPPPIFVRGYIRNYAKLLEVSSSDELVGAYNAVQPDESLPVIAAPKINYGGQVNTVNSKDWRVQIFTYLVFLGLALLLVLGGISTFSNKPVQSTAMELPQTTENAGEHTLALPRITENTAYEPPAENAENETAEGTDDVDSVTISLTSTNEDDAQEADAEPTFTAEQLHTVVVNYRLDSWTRIIDNTDEKVFEGVAKAGRSITVTGEPPFKMRFGVVQGVSVEYKNDVIEVETSPKRSGRTIVIGEPLPDAQ